MPHRFRQIQYAIARYSRGDFSKTITPSGKGDVLDAFIESLNMLGEELKVTTVTKQYFENIFNSAPDIIIILNAKGEIISANDALKKSREFTKTIQNTTYYFNDFFYVPSTGNAFRHLTTIQKGANPEIRVLLTSNPGKTFLCNISVLKKERKQTQYIAVLRDITELEQYQRRLLISESRYKEIFNSSSDGIFMFSQNGLIKEMNTTLINLLPAATKEADKLKNIAQIFTPVSMSMKDLLQTIASGKVIDNVEVKILVDEFKTIDGLFSCGPLYEDAGTTGYQGMLKNIAEYKKYNSLLLRSIDEMQEKERKRIAGDLHDSLGQQLIGIKLMMNSYMAMIKGREEHEYLQEINKNISATVEELRSICFDLMPGTLENFGLITSIEELLLKLKKIAPGCKIKLIASAGLPVLSKELEVALYRMIQELLNNALKYAQCSLIQITIRNVKNNHLILRFADNGKGFDAVTLKKKKGMGIQNIRTRVHAFNGTVQFSSKANKGTIYEIKIPVKV
jgi:signal transduction histidine kinase